MATTTYIKDIQIQNGTATNSYLIEPNLSGNSTYSSGVYTLTLDANFAYINGVAVQAKINTTNAANATLGVNNLTAKNIYYANNLLSASLLKANHTYTFVYKDNLDNDNGGWELVGDIDTNTHNNLVTQGTSTTPSWRKIILSGGTVYSEATTAVANKTDQVYQAEGISAQPSTGTLHATIFDGSGENLTNLDASNISSGTLNTDRLATSGVTAASYGPSNDTSVTYNGTFSVPYITVDDKGRITAASTKTITLPASDSTNTASAVDNILDGSNNGTAITYKPYESQQNKLSFDTSTESPSRTDRLNLNGYLYATKLYSGGTEVSINGHNHDDDYVNVTGDTMVSAYTDGTTALLTLAKASIVTTWPDKMKMLVLKGASDKEFSFKFSHHGQNVDIGYDWTAIEGAGAAFRAAVDSDDTSKQGGFIFFARKKGSNNTAITTQLIGLPGDSNNAGALTWGDRRVVTATNNTQIGSETQPVYVNNKGQIIAGTALGTASTQDTSYFATNDHKHTGTYLRLDGSDTMTGPLNLVGNQNSAWNNQGIIFTNGSRIGENTSDGFGIYGAGTIYIKPNSKTAASTTDGIILDNVGLYPYVTTSTYNLGTSTNKWKEVYAVEAMFDGYTRIDLTGTTTNLNDLNLSSGSPKIKRYIEHTDGGSTNISNMPVTGKPFILDVELIRWASTSDYITIQTFRNANNPANEYVRYCTKGTWGSWTTRVFTDTNQYHTTGSWNGLTYTATAVNNADALAFTIPTGYTASTVAAGNHTHSYIISKGNVTCETEGNKPAQKGLSMQNVYNNGYPTTYGNVLTMYGAGAGQLLLGWSGSSSTTKGVRANAYIRSQRDTADTLWSDWYTILDSGNYNNYAPTLTGVGASGEWNITAAQATADASGNTITTTYATKTEINGLLNTNNALVYKGVLPGADLDTANNNNYGNLTPAANCGDTYKVSVAGYINGLRVEIGDMLICTTDETAAAEDSGDNIYTTIQNNWNIIQTSEGSVSTSVTSSTDKAVARFDGISGRIIKDSKVNINDDGTLTVSGPVRIGSTDAANDTGYATANSGSNNYIVFYGVNGDGPGLYNHTYIGESIYGSKESANEKSELLLYHGNDPTTASGMDRIRLFAASVDIQVYTSSMPYTAGAATWNDIRAYAGTQVANFTNGKVTITGNVLPEATNSRTLGTSTYRWKELYIESQAAANGNGIMFYSGSNLYGRIGSNNDVGGIALYGSTHVWIRPSLTDITKGIELTETSLYPSTTSSVNLGTSSLKWNTLYVNTIYSGNLTIGGTVDTTAGKTLSSSSTLYINRATGTSIIFQQNGTHKIWIDTSNYLRPDTNNTLQVGTSDYKWNAMYATTFYGALSGNASSATALANSYTSSTRLTNANITHVTNGGIVHFKATSSMNTNGNKPASDGNILHFHWDTGDAWDAQLYIPDWSGDGASMQYRGSSTAGTWGSWKTLLDSSNYTTYTVKKDGTGASGSWGISITGTASSITAGESTGDVDRPVWFSYQENNTAINGKLGYNNNFTYNPSNKTLKFSSGATISTTDTDTDLTLSGKRYTYLTSGSTMYISNADNTSLIFRRGTTEYARFNTQKGLVIGGPASGTDVNSGISEKLYVNGTSKFLDTITAAGQIKTSFKNSIAMGSYVSAQTTIPNLLAEVRYSSGCAGSFNLTTAYTLNNVALATGWYNFMYIPHRSGGVNGSASGDNCNYGVLYLHRMNASEYSDYILSYSSSTITLLDLHASFQSSITDGQVLISDGTLGHIKTSGYTIAKSVPSNAVFTDHYAWTDITGKPDTYPPTIGTTNTTALAGNTVINKVKQTVKTDNVEYKILASAAGASPTSGTNYEAVYDSNITFNPSTSTITASIFKGTLNGTAANAIDANYKKYYYHDLFGFCYIGTPTFETTTDGQAWTTGTLDKAIFDQKNTTGIGLFGNNILGYRWTWVTNSFAYSGGAYVILSWHHTDPSATKLVVFETSTDGTTWTERGRAQGAWNASNTVIPIEGYANASRIRVTITKASENGTGTLANLRLLTARPGNQGQGIEYEYPYSWDKDKNITIKGHLYIDSGNTYDIGTSTSKWKTVYATTFSGNATTADAWSTARTLTIGYKGQSVSGSSDVAWLLSDIVLRASNEFNYTANGIKDLWFNYKTQTGTNATTKIENYYFGNGQSVTTGVTLVADNFSGISAKATSANLTTTATDITYYSNATGKFADGTGVQYLNVDGTKTGKAIGLSIIGTAYNAEGDLASGNAGVLSFGDPGPQIRFKDDTQQGVILFHRWNNGNSTVSFNFLSNEGSEGALVRAGAFIANNRIYIGTNTLGTAYNLSVNGNTLIGYSTLSNTAFVNDLVLYAHQSNESTTTSFDTAKSSWGIGFKRKWNNGTEGAVHAGIYAYGISNWRAGLAFRVKTGIAAADAHDTTALYLNHDGAATFASTISATEFLGGRLTHVGMQSTWRQGRDNALVAITSANAYSPLTSIKTENGSWELGAYKTTGAIYTDRLLVTYFSDATYDATSNNNSVSAQIMITKEGSIYPFASNNPTLGTSSYKWNTVYATTFSGNASSSTEAKWLMNRGTNVTIADSSWSHSQTGAGGTNTSGGTVWKQKWTQSGLTYTPSGGSATTLSDSGDIVLWLSQASASNNLYVNMAIDGYIYSMSGFKGGTFAITGASSITANIAAGTSSTMLALTNSRPAANISANQWFWGLKYLVTNMIAKTNACHVFGKANSSKNSGVLNYYHAGDANNSNYAGLGLYGVEDIFKVYANRNITIDGTLILNRVNANTYGRISYYKDSYHTWIDYMSNAGNGLAPTGGKPSSLGNVTSWALRSIIENATNYGWIWEATTEAAASANTVEPTARMALSSKTGYLRIAPDASSTTCETAGLIIDAAKNASSGNVAIELWRGGNASWQIANESGTLYFRNNYTTAKQSTYTQTSLSIAYNTGNATFAGSVTATGGFSGDLSGNATTATTASKVTMTAVTGTTGIKGYIAYSPTTTGGNALIDQDSLYVYNTMSNNVPAEVFLVAGKSQVKGGLTLYSATNANAWGNLVPATITAGTTQTWTLPNASGTIALTSDNITGNAETASKISAKLAKTTKAFLLGTATTLTDTAANVSIVGDTGVYLTTTAGEVCAGSYMIHTSGSNPRDAVKISYDGQNSSLNFVFIL